MNTEQKFSQFSFDSAVPGQMKLSCIRYTLVAIVGKAKNILSSYVNTDQLSLCWDEMILF